MLQLSKSRLEKPTRALIMSDNEQQMKGENCEMEKGEVKERKKRSCECYRVEKKQQQEHWVIHYTIKRMEKKNESETLSNYLSEIKKRELLTQWARLSQKLFIHFVRKVAGDSRKMWTGPENPCTIIY